VAGGTFNEKANKAATQQLNQAAQQSDRLKY